MSSHGYPDYQRYSQWFGAPLVDANDFAIGAGSHTDGPLQVNNWSSVILYVSPTGGSITATIRQTSGGISSGLVSDTVVSVAAGATKVQPVVLVGNTVSLILQGTAGGETVDYSLIPANTAVNAGTVSSAVLNLTPIALASWPPAAPGAGDLQVLELPAAYDPVGGKLLRWLCQYDSTNAQWDVLGGPALYAEVQTAESAPSAVYAALATAGPAITLPRAGDYVVAIGAQQSYSPSVTVGPGRMSFDRGGTGAVDADAIAQGSTAVILTDSTSREREIAGLTAVTLTAKYRSNNAGDTATFASRWMKVRPVRIS